MGEVFGSDIGFVQCLIHQRNDQRDCFSSLASSYQQVMDSVLNYPLYDAIVQGFTIPGPGNLSNVSAVMGQIQDSFKVA
jgi:alpha-amylase